LAVAVFAGKDIERHHLPYFANYYNRLVTRLYMGSSGPKPHVCRQAHQ